MFLHGVALKNTCLAIFLQIIKGSLAEFIFIKIPCFHSIFFWTLLDGSTWSMRLFFEMNLILDIQTNSCCKSLVAKIFDEITTKMKAVSPILVTKNKNCCFCFLIIYALEFDFVHPFLSSPDCYLIVWRVEKIQKVKTQKL